MEAKFESSIFWHRRDLRISDNAGLYKAQRASKKVYPIFIFDSNILSLLLETDQRIHFIHDQILKLKAQYKKHGSDLHVYFGNPIEIVPELAKSWGVDAVFTNRDYKPYAKERDASVFETLKANGTSFLGAKDQVIFEKNEVTKADGKPYTVFTPYSKVWLAKFNDFYGSSYPNEKYLDALSKREDTAVPSLDKLGFNTEPLIDFPKDSISQDLIENYAETRETPSIQGTSRLGVHLRFGTISIRKLAQKASKAPDITFLKELIWRDFYHCILYHFPHSAKDSFKPKYDKIEWRNNEEEFQAWMEGKTGYPMVDAGMRELAETGYMHNRVRMVVASFLTKHLLIDWRWGAAYFAEKLLDFDLASNSGGWQWASGSGCDAAPYFRVFNPESQQKKFDPKFVYIKQWIPEFGTENYPEPIVEHKMARQRAIDTYKACLS